MSALRPFFPSDPVQIPTGIPTVQQIVDCWFVNCSRGQNHEALAERCRLLDLFCDVFGNKSITEARPADLVLWLNSHPEWKSDWTLKRVVETIKLPFNWANDLRIIDRSPYHGVTHCSGEPIRPMEDQEFRKLLRGTTAIFRRVLIFLRFSGARPGGMSALQWDQYHADEDVFVIPRKTRGAKVTRRDKKPLTIVLHPVAVRLVKWIRQHGPHEKFVFVNSKGNPWKRYAISCRIKRLRKKLGLPIDCKLFGLRHGFGTTLLLNGVELKTASELMGHTTTRTTEQYIHIRGKAKHLRTALIQGMTSRSAEHLGSQTRQEPR